MFSPAALAALGVVCALACTTFPAWADEPYPHPMPGGWSSASPQDEAVRKAARFAVHEQNRRLGAHLQLLAIKHARIQVVAGYNYSLNLLLHHDGKRRLAVVTIWSKPDGSMELTRWHWV